MTFLESWATSNKLSFPDGKNSECYWKESCTIHNRRSNLLRELVWDSSGVWSIWGHIPGWSQNWPLRNREISESFYHYLLNADIWTLSFRTRRFQTESWWFMIIYYITQIDMVLRRNCTGWNWPRILAATAHFGGRGETRRYKFSKYNSMRDTLGLCGTMDSIARYKLGEGSTATRSRTKR